MKLEASEFIRRFLLHGARPIPKGLSSQPSRSFVKSGFNEVRIEQDSKSRRGLTEAARFRVEH
jgi:hypothetical protein